jgi:hypothetical protein
MKYTPLLLAASMVVYTQAQLRGLQTSLLAQKWNISQPTFAYDGGLHFDVNYQVTDFINDNMVTFKIYNRDCEDGSNSVSHTILKAQKQALTNTYVAGGRGTGARTLTIDIAIDSAAIITTDTIDFCVRFSLQTDSFPSIEVNFVETVITLNVDLYDAFGVGQVNFADKKDNGSIHVFTSSELAERILP